MTEAKDKLSAVTIEQIEDVMKVKEYPQEDQSDIMTIARLPKDKAIPALRMRIMKLKADPYGNGRTVDDYKDQVDFLGYLITLFERM